MERCDMAGQFKSKYSPAISNRQASSQHPQPLEWAAEKHCDNQLCSEENIAVGIDCDNFGT
jgi:hypothetical protein